MVILPDYSNLQSKPITTTDMYAISILKGSKVIMTQGGAVGNVMLIIESGNVVVNCSKELKIADCAEVGPFTLSTLQIEA